MRVWLIPLLLLMAAFALPPASAAPGYECAEQNLTGDTADPDHLQVNLRRDCSLEIVALEGILCVGGWGGVIERDIDRHTVRAHYCTGGPLPDIKATTAMPGCSPKTYQVEDPAQGVTHTVETHHNCRADVTLNEGVTCVGAWTATDRHEVGPISITNHRCAMPGGDPTFAAAAVQPCEDRFMTSWAAQVETHSDCTFEVHLIDAYRLCDGLAGLDSHRTGATIGPAEASLGYCTPSLSATDAAGPCPSTQYLGIATVYADGACNLQIDVKLYDCVWNCAWKTLVDTDPLTIRYYGEDNGDRVGPCGTYKSFGAGSVETTTGCEVILTLEPMQCVWGGSWITTEAGPVTVRRYNCNYDPYPPQAAAVPACNGIVYAERDLGIARVVYSSPCVDVYTDPLGCGSYQTVGYRTYHAHVGACTRSTDADPLPGGSCGIVYNEYNVGPITVAESSPCFGVGVDLTGGACDQWTGVGVYTVSVGVRHCL